MSAFNTLCQALYSCGLESGRKYVPCILKYVRHILNYVRPNFFLLQAEVKTYVHKLTFRTPQKYALPPCNSGCKQTLSACRHTFAVRNNAISHKPPTLRLKNLSCHYGITKNRNSSKKFIFIAEKQTKYKEKFADYVFFVTFVIEMLVQMDIFIFTSLYLWHSTTVTTTTLRG